MIRKLKNTYHYFRAISGAFLYGFPTRRLKLIGVTGTDGKTTTTALIYHILKSAGRRVSMISSVYAKIGGQEYDTGFHVTSPDPFVLPKYLKMSADKGDEYFVLEVTSHGLDQNRIGKAKFEIGVLTNITHEHLDYHKTYEQYVKAKAKLFRNSKFSFVNKDDDSYRYIQKYMHSEHTLSHQKVFTYALTEKADFGIDISEKIHMPLAVFNKYNYLAAYGVCRTLGLSDDVIFSAMKTYELPPGRIEVVAEKPFTVIIDFAHTPNAIKHILQFVKDRYKKQNNRLIHVFSSAALRDESKRPFMGEESAKYSDLVILSEEDYRNEDPLKINSEIAIGLEKHGFKKVESSKFNGQSKLYTVIINREEAIKKAVSTAKEGDIIVLTGKGHEKSLCRGKKEYPWDEKKAVEKALMMVKSV